ncbi:MAG: NHL repeat-containing protein, partial [Candidatus Paceibacterota bacterium]
MREKAKRIALILGVAVFIFFTFQYFSLVSKSYAYLLNASDLLGQLDENDQPVYTKMGIGNSPNNSGLNYPLAGIGGVTVDSSNHRLFLSDTYNNRVLIFNLDINNHLIDRIADYVLGQLNFSTNQGGIGSNVLNHPTNLIYDADGQRLFVLDPDNNRILIFDVNIIINGENAVNVLGQNDFLSNTSGLGPNKLTLGSSEVNGLTYDSVNKRLFVGDLGNNRIMIFDVLTITNGENAVNVLGAINLTTLGSGACATSSVYAVTDLTYDSTKQFLYVVAGWALTSQRVLVFDVNSITNGEDAINVLGQQDFITCTDGVAANKFSYPMGAVIDQANQKLYVADQNNFRILIFDVSTITNGENAVNVLGQTDFISNSGGTTQDKLNQPTALALSNNQLFVIDTRNNRLVIFDTEVISNGEAMVDLIGQTDDLYNAVYTNSNVNNSPNGRGFNSPTHSALDSINRRLFIADYSNNRILIFNLDANDRPQDYMADYVLGQTDFISNISGVTQNKFSGPVRLHYDSDHNRLFVLDRNNSRILIFDLSSGIINGMNASYVLGQTDFISNISITTQSGLSSSRGLTYDSINQKLFVADSSNSRVMIFDVASITNGEDAVNVLGQTDFISNGVTPTQSGLNYPDGVAYDSTNQRLFVADKFNNRVMIFDVASITNGEDAVNVLGQTDFISNISITTQSGLSSSRDLTYDSINQKLFVADSSNSRVMIFDVASITNGEDAVNVLGQTD